ncbi:MAG: DUF4124 domain-containing protein [Pseudomonadota bacterium]
MKALWTVLLVASVLQLSVVSDSQAQGVYKWVDADGKVHYGSQPPATTSDKGAEPLKMQSHSGFGGNNNPSSQPNTDGTKKIPKEVEDMRDGLVKGLKKLDPKSEPLSCATAVDNVRSQVDTMLEVGQRNTKDGYISQAEFDATATKLRQAKSESTLGDCEGSSGSKRAFYQCMSSNHNHVSGCGSKYTF